MSRRVPATAIVAVALGGAAGAVLRWALTELVPDGGGFPWTTFAVNVSGCLAIGLLPAVFTRSRRPLVTAAVAPGLLGGYTTMSAYAEQTRALLAGGQQATGLAYLGGTLLASLAAVLLAERLTGDHAADEVAP